MRGRLSHERVRRCVEHRGLGLRDRRGGGHDKRCRDAEHERGGKRGYAFAHLFTRPRSGTVSIKAACSFISRTGEQRALRT